MLDLHSKDVVLWKEMENEALTVYFSGDCTEYSPRGKDLADAIVRVRVLYIWIGELLFCNKQLERSLIRRCAMVT
jgi:hypothetical protein